MFDYTNFKNPPSLILYMNPFDNVQIKLRYKTPTFLSDLSRVYNLYYDIEAEDSQGKIDSYGTFDHGSYIIGIIFESKNYTISFVNEGTESIKFAMVFSMDSYFPPQFKFPINKYNLEDSMSKYDPFLYDVGHQFSYAIFIVIGVLCIIYLYMFKLFLCDHKYWC